jgi:LacI family transcriptional regulator
MRPYPKITTTQLAKICNVSQGTVDRALNNRPGISAKTKQKVLEAAKKYGYTPNIHARYLAGGKSMLVGIVVFDLYNEFFSNMVMEIEAICRSKNYSTVVMFSNKEKETEIECIKRLAYMGVDAIIMCPVSQGEQYRSYLQSFNIPIVTLLNEIEGIPCSGINDFQAMKDVTQYVISKGYTEIIYFAPPLAYGDELNIHSQKQRFLGFKEEASSFLKYCVKTAEFDTDSINENTAIICSTDYHALQIIRKNDGKTKGIIGFDNISILDLCGIKIDSVAYPIAHIAKNAVDIIINNSKKSAYVPHTIVKRGSI